MIITNNLIFLLLEEISFHVVFVTEAEGKKISRYVENFYATTVRNP